MCTAATFQHCDIPLEAGNIPFAAVAPAQGESYKTIRLTQGKVTIVDFANYEFLSRWNWYAKRTLHTWYAVRMEYGGGKGKQIRMHRQILKPPPGMETDHKDGDGLNNRKRNLRVATSSQNKANQRKTRGTSKFKGVSWHKRNKKWCANIKLNGKGIYLGSFNTEIDGARAYDRASEQLFGEFAQTNF